MFTIFTKTPSFYIRGKKRAQRYVFFFIFAENLKEDEHPFRPVANQIVGSRKRV